MEGCWNVVWRHKKAPESEVRLSSKLPAKVRFLLDRYGATCWCSGAQWLREASRSLGHRAAMLTSPRGLLRSRHDHTLLRLARCRAPPLHSTDGATGLSRRRSAVSLPGRSSSRPMFSSAIIYCPGQKNTADRKAHSATWRSPLLACRSCQKLQRATWEPTCTCQTHGGFGSSVVRARARTAVGDVCHATVGDECRHDTPRSCPAEQ